MDYLGHARGDRPREGRHLPRRPARRSAASRDPPASLVAPRARDRRAALRGSGASSTQSPEAAQWRYSRPGRRALRPADAGAARRATSSPTPRLRSLRSISLRDRLPVSAGAIRAALVGVELAGRFQVLPGGPTIVLDVAHNPHAARVLAAALGEMGFHPRNARGVRHAGRQGHRRRDRRACEPRIDRWHVAPLPGPRGAPRRDADRGVSPRPASPTRRSAGTPTSMPRIAARATRWATLIESSFSARSSPSLRRSPRIARRRSAREPALSMAEPADINVDELRRRARRRLVGAIVLALAAAVVVPMLLESDPKPLGESVAVKIPPVDDGKFVNRLSEPAATSAARRRSRAKTRSRRSSRANRSPTRRRPSCRQRQAAEVRHAARGRQEDADAG